LTFIPARSSTPILMITVARTLTPTCIPALPRTCADSTRYFQYAVQLVKLVPFKGNCNATGELTDAKKLKSFLKACTSAVVADHVLCIDIECRASGDVNVALQGSSANLDVAIKHIKQQQQLDIPKDSYRTSSTALNFRADKSVSTLDKFTQRLCATLASCDKQTKTTEKDWTVYEHKQCTECPGGRYQDERGKTQCRKCAAHALTRDAVSQAACSFCADGHAVGDDGACAKCAAGKFSRGGKMCMGCNTSTYSEAGSVACTSCGSFSYVVADGNAHSAGHAFLTTEEAIALGIAAAVIFIIALLLTAGCIHAWQKKLNEATEDEDCDWMFEINKKGVGYWRNEVTMEISLTLPEDANGPPNDMWIQVLNVDKETVGYYNTVTMHLVCEMVKDVSPNETFFELPDSKNATSPNTQHIWNGIYQHSVLVSEFEGWEERYDGMTGSLFYVSDTGDFYWKPLESPAPKHKWHKLTDPHGKFVCYYNIIEHEINDEIDENEVVNEMRLNDTYLRGCTDCGDGSGSIGKSWHTLEKNSTVVAEKFGWEWCYVPSKQIWYYHDAVFSRYQWDPPDEWAAVRYIRFGDDDESDDEADDSKQPEFYDYIEQRMVTHEQEDYDGIIDFEVVTGNVDIQGDLISHKIELPSFN